MGDKEKLRNLYRPRREALRRDARAFLLANEGQLLDEFAEGRDVSVAAISPEVREVTSDADTLLYRYACLQWSVPVTGGYGRRTRFLVRDRFNGKLIGVFALRVAGRPNPLGCSVVRLDRVEGATLRVRGLDVLDGTPVLDLKPYLPLYDCASDARLPGWALPG